MLNLATNEPWTAPARAVLLFLADDCPISQRYIPRLNGMTEDWSDLPFYSVYEQRYHTPQDVNEHQLSFEIRLQPLLDPGVLRRALGVSRTPTAVVLSNNKVGYRGRIDNWYEGFGKRRPRPTENDLLTALETIAAGRSVPEPWPEPVGCSISDSER